MRLLTWILTAAAVLALAVAPARAGVVFTLTPSTGTITGDAGQTIGWGLTIENDASGWLVISSVTFDQSTSIGTFSDFLTPQFFFDAVAPGGVWTQFFGAATFQGLGSYVIDGSFALPGDQAIGNLDLLFDIHSTNPNAVGYDPFSDNVTSHQAFLPASVTYQETPEPTGGILVLTGLALWSLVKAARRHA